MKTTPSFMAWIVVCLALTQATFATPALLTGTINMNGVVQLDTANVNSANVALNWTNAVNIASGSFASALNQSVVFSPNAWSFNSGPVTNFWSAGGFTFDLASSTVGNDSHGFLNVTLIGTVYGNGFARTACAGSFSVVNVLYQGSSCFTPSLQFSAVAAPPSLSIVHTGPNYINVCWPTNTYNYTLLQSSSSTGTSWVPTSFTVTNGFGTNYCIVPCTTNRLFFKLSL